MYSQRINILNAKINQPNYPKTYSAPLSSINRKLLVDSSENLIKGLEMVVCYVHIFSSTHFSYAASRPPPSH
jgi:hypothetical protein